MLFHFIGMKLSTAYIHIAVCTYTTMNAFYFYADILKYMHDIVIYVYSAYISTHFKFLVLPLMTVSDKRFRG